MMLNLLYLLIFLTIRRFCVKKRRSIFLYYGGLFCLIFFACIGGGSVINEDIYNLKQFVLLEKGNQLESAKNDPKTDESLLHALQYYKTSDELKKYIEDTDINLRQWEAAFLGLLLSMVAEILLLAARWLYEVRKLKARQD